MVLVRDLEPSDFTGVVEYYYHFYEEVEEDPSFGIVLFHNKPSLSDELQWFSGTYRDAVEGPVVVTVAEIDSHLVGLCKVSGERPGSDVSHRAQLGVSVSRDYRGRGVGTALLEETLRKCRGKFEIIELSVLTTNHVARKLYAKFGFKNYGTRPRSIKRGDAYIDEELLRLDLEPQG